MKTKVYSGSTTQLRQIPTARRRATSVVAWLLTPEAHFSAALLFTSELISVSLCLCLLVCVCSMSWPSVNKYVHLKPRSQTAASQGYFIINIVDVMWEGNQGNLNSRRKAEEEGMKVKKLVLLFIKIR